jgi:hypothetical protein
LGEYGAGFGADGEAGGHRNFQAAHLGQVGAFAAQQVFHAGVALGLAGTENIDVLGGGGHVNSSSYWFGETVIFRRPQSLVLMHIKAYIL